MRLLLIHAEYFRYKVREKAIESAEELDGVKSEAESRNTLVCFCTVEKGDERNPEAIAESACSEVLSIMSKVRASSVVLYPYAHLSQKLADPITAVRVLKMLEEKLKERGIEVIRAPFGYYKSFEIKCIGHPLSELSRTITPAEKVPTHPPPKPRKYLVLTPEGALYDPQEFVEKYCNDDEVRVLVEKEALRKELPGGREPKIIDYCRKFGIEWEGFSDIGHMRFGPEATILMDLIAKYSWQVANELGIPVYRVSGTNMFNLDVPPVRKHAELFGERMYTIEVDGKFYVLRFAACHQQFSMLKDWVISYRDLPFGVFELADSYRLEQPGELLLCFRLRKFLMPDLHILCRDLEEAKEIAKRVHVKILEEARKLGRRYVSLYNLTESFFNAHRDFIQELVKLEGRPVLLHFVEEGKYYWVINVEYHIIDELGRPREIATFQIDVGNAERFGIKYVDEKGQERYPVIIHTALIGSLERYLYTVLDTAAQMELRGEVPKIPTWLCPVQIRVIPVSSEYVKFACEIADELERHGFRVDVDDRDETVSRKIREAEVSWIPYIVVVGKKELESGRLSVRIRGVGVKELSLPELIKLLEEEVKGYPRTEIKLPRFLSRRPRYKTSS
ncbi:MAG: threonine--tRNA ligase [Thermoprotei archaeon]|nr:MAG: threonine--tRNA ligase [Thermoprotei archaeon]